MGETRSDMRMNMGARGGVELMQAWRSRCLQTSIEKSFDSTQE